MCQIENSPPFKYKLFIICKFQLETMRKVWVVHVQFNQRPQSICIDFTNNNRTSLRFVLTSYHVVIRNVRVHAPAYSFIFNKARATHIVRRTKEIRSWHKTETNPLAVRVINIYRLPFLVQAHAHTHHNVCNQNPQNVYVLATKLLFETQQRDSIRHTYVYSVFSLCDDAQMNENTRRATKEMLL